MIYAGASIAATWAPKGTDAAGIDRLKAELDALLPLTAAQVTNLKRLFDIDFTFNSTAIEGNTFSLQETRIVLLDGITIGGKSTREHLEIVNHKLAETEYNVYSGQDRDMISRKRAGYLHQSCHRSRVVFVVTMK